MGVGPVLEPNTPTISSAPSPPPVSDPSPTRGFFLGPQKLPQHVVQDAAVAVILDLLRGVETEAGFEGGRFAVLLPGPDGHLAAVLEVAPDPLGEAFDVDQLVAGEAEGGGVLARQELQGSDAHADEVAAVDALEALGDDG